MATGEQADPSGLAAPFVIVKTERPDGDVGQPSDLHDAVECGFASFVMYARARGTAAWEKCHLQTRSYTTARAALTLH